MSKYSEAHLLSLVSTIGVRTTRGGYRKDPECDASLQDITRFLQKDSSERDVFLQLIAWNVLGKDLLPLLGTHCGELSTSFLVVKLLVFLTLPPEKESTNFIAQNQALNSTLRVLLDHACIFPKLMLLVSEALGKLETGNLENGETLTKILQLTFTLVRNLLLIARSHSLVGSKSSNVRHELFRLLLKCQFMEVLSAVIQDACVSPINNDLPLLVEIFALILCFHENDSNTSTHLNMGTHSAKSAQWSRKLSKFGISKAVKGAVRGGFSGVYVKHSEYAESERLLRGNPIETHYMSRACGILIPSTSSTSELQPWQVGLLTNLSAPVVNQFLFSAWDDLKRSKQMMISSVEHTIRCTNYVQLCLFFVDIFHSKLASGTAEEVVLKNPVASILCADFLIWIQKEWFEFEQNKSLQECIPLIELLASIATTLKSLQVKSADSTVQLACKAMRSAYVHGESKHEFVRLLRTRIKQFKWLSMPAPYLRALFLLHGAIYELLADDNPNSVSHDVREQLREFLVDRIIVENHVGLMYRCESRNERETKYRVEFLKQLASSTVFRLSTLLSLRRLEKGHRDISTASKELCLKAVKQLCRDGVRNPEGWKGSVFINLLAW
jgi:hypothetical protein